MDRTLMTAELSITVAREPCSELKVFLFTAAIKSLLCLSLVILYLHASTAKSDEITIVADHWYPYNGQPNSSQPGYGIDIATQIFEAAGHTVVYQVMPWNRAIIKTRQGRYNAVIGALKEEAPDFIFPLEEFGVATEAFFATKGSEWRFDSLESLKTVQVGLISDYSYSATLDDFFNANPKQVQYVKGGNALELNIKKLLYGRVDVIVEDPNVLHQKAHLLGVSEQLVRAGEHSKVSRLYIAFSPNLESSKKYAQLFTQGIRKLQQSGQLMTILNRYGLTYWK